jgi:hypothetical protein
MPRWEEPVEKETGFGFTQVGWRFTRAGPGGVLKKLAATFFVLKGKLKRDFLTLALINNLTQLVRHSHRWTLIRYFIISLPLVTIVSQRSLVSLSVWIVSNE